ncbi:hypothetical protein M2318_003931 [Metapseudomonas resinovorans]|uniref:hypothetical protein n=1 Tax=Metapseudomonas resinovorans TaxID=53412 RepID=UPI003D20BD27
MAISSFGDSDDDQAPAIVPRAVSSFGDEADDDLTQPATSVQRVGRHQLPQAITQDHGPTAIGDVGRGLLRGVGGAAQAVIGLGNLVSGGGAGRLAAQSGYYDPQAADQRLNQQDTPELQQARRELDQAQGFTDTLGTLAGNPRLISEALAQAAPSMLLGGGIGRGALAAGQLAGRAGPLAQAVAVGLGEGAVSAGQIAEQTRQQTGTLTPSQAGLAIGAGAATGVLGMAGAKLGRMLGVQDVDALLAGADGANVARSLVNRVLAGSGLESLEEMGQSSQEQVLGNIAQGRHPFEGVGQAAAMGATVGGLMGGAAGLRRPTMGQLVQAPNTITQQPTQQPQAQPVPSPAVPPQQAASAPAALVSPAPAPSPAVPFAGSVDVRPLFQSMGMDPQQMERSLELLRPVESDIETQRRGVQSWEETGRLAALTGTTIEQLRKHRAGVLFNAEEQVAATRLLRDKTTRVIELGNRIAKGTAGEIDQANFLQNLADLRTAQRAVMASRAEIGRALNVMRADVSTMRQANQMLESVGGAQGAKAIADAITNAARVGGVEAANKMARHSGSDLFWTMYKSALLSSPDTHAVNVISNLFTAGLQMPTRALAGGIGAAKRLATGGRAGETRMGEAAYQLAGAVEGAVLGARGAVESWRTGADAFGIDANKFEGYRNDLPGQKVWGVPLRLLQSEDAFFKFLNDGMERYSVAYRMASQELKGQGPAAVHKRVQELIANPPKELVEAGEDAALFHTFNNQAGKITQAINNLRHSLPAGTGNLVIPFLRTPANLITYAVKHSPAAPVFKQVRQDLAAGGARQETALARMGIGSLLVGLGAFGVMGGGLTGGGPSDPEERRAWLAAGNQPYSLKINGRWTDYSRIEPFASLVGIAADVASGAQDQALGVGELVKAIGRNFLSKTWLQGLSGVMQAMSDPDRYGDRWVGRTAATLSQPWTAIAHAGRYGDPYQRQAEGFLESLRYRLPGETIGREGLLPKLDGFGEPIPEADRQIGRAGPFKHGPAGTADPVRREAGRLGWSPSEPEKQIKPKGQPQITLTSEQHHEFSQLAGRLIHRGAQQLMASPKWSQLGDDAKTDALDLLAKKARTAVRLAFIPALVAGNDAPLNKLRQTLGGAKP